MASLTATASFVAGGRIADRPSMSRRRRSSVGVAVAVAAAKLQSTQEAASPAPDAGRVDGGSGGRRAAMLAAAAAAVCALGQGIATAGTVPKPGTPQAKKFYAPICVTMPTASVCHK
ncbi:photosystem II 5 kDa protein, chloroplastic-like [Ananas comosus]|uniref:Photosystem II 5 kDa protein, chloroplastic n=1 Tax=Ananas comosus TaxID=4615 RepID=A0A199VTE4_ANACO|nr:photosystem II 5 kDa protein, chloroplastic-like [Ananas comosus]OAY80268.1 Photosystem II 5 kDa protein, chloroplastic [Ananas comosus]